MTKHDEIVAKAQLGLEDANKVVARVDAVELVCEEALVVCGEGVKVKPVQKIAPVKAKVNVVVQSKLGRAVGKLYDLEQTGAAEKKLNADLDLYQMENY